LTTCFYDNRSLSLNLLRDEITEDKLLEITQEKTLTNIVELNLACCNLHSIKALSNLKNLRSINLAFNELVKLDELCYFYALESIDVSYNKLVTLNGMKGLTKLVYLIATNNFLRKSLDEALTLKRYSPNIKHLDLRGNPFDKVRMKLITRVR
jgi:Leucine-rich repeat (LRR) protein